MNAQEILAELKELGGESYKRLLMKNYGVKEPCFGVKIGDMKKIQKRVKMDYQLALDLFDTGNYDAMYLAGLIADDEKMTEKDLQRWVKSGNTGALPGATVPWVAAGSPHGWKLALEWIDSATTHIAVAGWSTLASLVAITPDTELDLKKLKQLIERVEKGIHKAPDLVRYAMNDFLISAGSYVPSLTECAVEAGEKAGKITAHLGNNSCQIPFAPEKIREAEKKGTLGKKRKTVKC